MKVSVWDTYVPRENGKVMHFDILVPEEMKDEEIIFNYGREYLNSKSFSAENITSNECRYCHMEQASPAVENQISEKGYFIIEMENCQ